MQNHFSIIFLIFALLPIVSASSFTGYFYDYGNDTGNDGLYNQLVIEAGVDINDITKQYMVYGMLEDAQGNTIESIDCKSMPFGTYNSYLTFDGIRIYKNQINGPYRLKYIELSAIGNCSGFGFPPTIIDSRIYAHTTLPYNYNQFQRGEPAIYCNNSPCIAPSGLIGSRDNLNVPEPNAPNTIDGCEDGGSGKYLQDESIESIKVVSLNNSFFKPGDQIQVDIDAYCDSAFDKLNLAYANDIGNHLWSVKGAGVCSFSGLRKFQTTFNLDNNIGQHAIRGVFGFGLNSNKVCGDSYYDDNDDVVIYVKECSSGQDCKPTNCDYLDACVSGTYRDYHNITNICNADFTCSGYGCASYSDIITDLDGDGYDVECDNDCNDRDKSINPVAVEICNNGKDDNCNGDVDMYDASCQGGYKISLQKGWNLLSIPNIINGNISEVVKIFNNSYEKILVLKNGEWLVFDNKTFSNLNNISESEGFWIKMPANSSILIQNKSADYALFNITKGWNLVGYPSLNEKNVSELFENVIGDIEILYAYDAEFLPYNPKKPGDFIIKPGMGIFINAKNDAKWFFNGKYDKSNELFILDLFGGWNLISLPLISNKSVSEIFGAANLYYLDGGRWRESTSAEMINYSRSYWINENKKSLVISGSKINKSHYDLKKGLNLINYPLDYETNVADYFNYTIDNIRSIKTFEDGLWKSYSPSRPSGLNSLKTLKPGRGIAVEVFNDERWYFDGKILFAT